MTLRYRLKVADSTTSGPSRYYALPSVSLRDVVWHQIKANRTFHGVTCAPPTRTHRAAAPSA